MKISLCRRVLAIGVIYWLSSGFAFSATANEEGQNLAWKNWLKNQIENHPELIAAKQQLKAQLFLADAVRAPSITRNSKWSLRARKTLIITV